MENYLNIVDLAKKMKLLTWKSYIYQFKNQHWDFFLMPHMSYLDLSIEEKSAMFRWYYNNLVSKYFAKSSKLF